MAYEREYRWRAGPLFLSQAVALAVYMLWRQTWALPVAPLAGAAAVGASIAGLAVRVWGTAQLSEATMVSMAVRTGRLISHGAFAVVRNPLYLGDLLIFTSYGLLLNPWLAVPFGAYHVVRILRLIAYEERHLRARWGPTYEAYCRSVPRLVPRPVAVGQGAGNGAWPEALRANAIWIGFVSGYTAAAVTGDLWSLTPFEAGGFLYFWYHFSRKTSAVSARDNASAG
jgi:protein-S-isoprenylcysteine O-methyltransferase Ste14